jgi:nucleoside phosphorylase
MQTISNKCTNKSIHQADIGIITFVEDEFNAVRDILGLSEEPVRVEGRDYYTGKVESIVKGNELFIVCAQCRDRSNIPAGLLAQAFMSAWKPTYFFVVGIAGGVSDRENISCGDVVVHTNLMYYEFKKHINGMSKRREFAIEPPSPILLDSAQKINKKMVKIWWQKIKTNRPAGEEVNPKVIRGEILSGDKLLGDPKSRMLEELLDEHDRAIAVEMESGGVARALYEVRAKWIRTEFLIIRGITDYCDRKGNQEMRNIWKPYAAQAAAAYTFELIRSIYIEPKRLSIKEQYMHAFESSLNIHKLDFGEPEIDFKLTISTNDDILKRKITIEDLIGETEKRKRVILRGPAGGGKSKALGKLARLLIKDKKLIPVLLNLKHWAKIGDINLNDRGDTTENWTYKLDILFRTSINDLSYNVFKKLLSQNRIFLMVDGLNEVTAGDFSEENTRQILDTLYECVRNTFPETCVLVTDRMAQRPFQKYDWDTMLLDSLDEVSVKEKIIANFGEGKYIELSANDRRLLEIPYFLNYAIDSSSLHLGSAAKSINSFFKNHMKYDDNTLDMLAKAAFNMYEHSRSSSFSATEFKNIVGEYIYNDLLHAAVLKSPVEDRTQFDHQLKHDYLASRYLAQNGDAWNMKAFDIVSFQSNSFEPLSMILEQLSDELEGDKFLKSVYDWNWFSAVWCAKEALKTGHKRFTDEMKIALIAIVAEKLFDPIISTNRRTKSILEKFPDEMIDSIMKTNSIDDLHQLIEKYHLVVKGWFPVWKNLFLRKRESFKGEDDIKMIVSNDPILGWTASNVIKRIELTDKDLCQLRSYYEATCDKPNRDETPSDMTRRWRVVHTLGGFDTEENANLLLRALDSDNYLWVRYGAARSLVEIAASTDNFKLSKYIVKELKRRVANLPRRVNEEIGMASLNTGAQSSWTELVHPLLEAIRKNQKVEADKARWKEILEDFIDFYKKGK